MNKNAIQKYAIWARNELIEQVKQRAFQYGIDEKGYGDENASVITGRVLSADEKRQRQLFVNEIKKSGYNQAVEEVAYTWFNRFVALRYMEVNDFLPTHIRVFSDASGNFNPEILTNVLHLDLPSLDRAKVSEYLNGNQTEELYRYLLLTQCNALNVALPEMFEKLGSYTEMLLPNNILKQDSVLARLVKDIDEDDWKDAVQIIGWMYQYYNTELKQAVFDGLKKNVKITKEKIPAATQLFTPDWIVRYMVENSLGRLWLESHPNDPLKAEWKYYLDEAEQMPEVVERLRVLRSQSPVMSPEDIRLIDPCMGSGHILVYAFDVLMQIYVSEGYNPREASKLILEKNIYGLDIDRRAYQLAYFSLMMKARQYNRRIFTEDIKPQVYHPVGFPDGEDYGSLVKVDKLPQKPVEKTGQLSFEDTNYDLQLNAWNFKRLLVQKYDIVVTNPPYAGASGVNGKLGVFLKDRYPDTKYDMFSAFIEQCIALTKRSGFVAMITQQAWMFLGSYEKLRNVILSNNTIINMAHLGNGAFGFADFGLTSFVIRTSSVQNYQGLYIRLVEDMNPEWKEITFRSGNYRYVTSSNNFSKIQGRPIAYRVTTKTASLFDNQPKLNKFGTVRSGLQTSDNNRFLKLWYEVSAANTFFDCGSHEESRASEKKWYPHIKGGEFRKWYGNLEYVLNWKHDGEELYAFATKLYKSPTRIIKSTDFYFMPCITWSHTTAKKQFAARRIGSGTIFNVEAPSIFDVKDSSYFVALMNSKIFTHFFVVINETIHFLAGDTAVLPVAYSPSDKIEYLSDTNVAISRADWDAFETSWDFMRHPLICSERTVAEAFAKWEREAAERFDTLKANEEELNRIFIDIYGLQEELTPEVEDKDVTVRRADLGREVRSLISYAVGCMLGRYSLDFEGLAYAGGGWEPDKYKTLPVDKDNILPICDDEYFDDDITGRFVNFVKTVYGADTLEENLKFIADALGGKGTPREVIRNYFLNDFYKDHVKIYQKRPIYWLFDSGKKNGFKALIYMHRYSRDLLAKLRTDYVHEQQERYRTQLSHIASALNTASGADRAKLLKQQDKLTEQLREITAFEEKVHHLADQNIMIDLDDGVKKNYGIFTEVLAKI
ncbi:BREX-1 system adenine-specific DNA-methyltransferase PglX [Streptococcus parasuis]|uniref:BREX-1 system adenine-specific DNA-methyltransferase PglX n=1 Tax=Streptococcus parasuis TaxID=1501662 RepID=UPI0028AB1211|nr:BREX-1 system adenine-specific DNA-methyltransferase PglX [Streptococcus parasuis]